jgi:tripartite-type tricarboxylate transporter receptor subunit TctC
MRSPMRWPVRASMKASIALLVLLAASSALQAAPTSYPSRPVRILVSVGAGSTTDATARAIAEPLSRALGQPVLVENRPGADGAIAAEAVRNAAPDGHTLLFGQATSLVAIPLTRKIPPYDPVADFTPVSFVGRFTICLFAHAGVPANTLAEVIDYARSNPNKISYSTNSMTEAIVGAQLAKSAGVSMVRVPYKGPTAVLPDLLAGRLQLAFMAAAAGLSQVRDGRLRALATLLPRRSAALPDVPTIAEAGFPAATMTPWFGIVGPAKMPKDIVDRLSAEIGAALALPEVRTQLERHIVEAEASTPEAMLAFLKLEMESWRRAVADAGIELD